VAVAVALAFGNPQLPFTDVAVTAGGEAKLRLSIAVESHPAAEPFGKNLV
jgi:hypothetical protein